MVTRQSRMTLLLQPFPEKVRGAENLYLIYCRVWIYVPTLNRKVSDLRPVSHKRGPHSIWRWKHLRIRRSSFEFLSALLNHQEFTPVGDIVLLCLLDRVQVWALRNDQMSQISCSLWERAEQQVTRRTFAFSCFTRFAFMPLVIAIRKLSYYLAWFIMRLMVFDNLSVRSALQQYGADIKSFDLFGSSAVIYWDFFLQQHIDESRNILLAVTVSVLLKPWNIVSAHFYLLQVMIRIPFFMVW